MYCSLCEKYSLNKDQTMIQGCKIFHKNSLKQHEKSKFHKLSKKAELNHHNMTTIVKRKIGDNEENIFKLMKLCYFIAKENLSFCKFEPLIRLTEIMGMNYSTDLYKSRYGFAY